MFANMRSICYTIRMKTNIIKYRTCVCNINYHVVWCVKYRRKIITPQIEQFLKELAQEIRSPGIKASLYTFLKQGKWTISTVSYRHRQNSPSQIS